MLEDTVTYKDTKLNFVITGNYSSLNEFLDATCRVIEQIKLAGEDVFDDDVYEPCGTASPVEEPHTVTIFI